METDIRKVLLRRNPRLGCDLVASAKVGAFNSRRTLAARILNYSETGALAELPERVAKGERLRLRWAPPGDKARSISATVEWTDGQKHGLRFDRTLSEARAHEGEYLRKSLAFFGACAAFCLIVMVKGANFYWFWHSPFLAAYSLLASIFVMTRLFISLFYKLPPDEKHYPTFSVVITAMNEEVCITETIDTCFASRYPAELFEVIAVDDGSTDKTWDRMVDCQKRYGAERLRLIKFEQNKGKRHAMADGAEAATGEILLYVDSDTFCDPEAMYRIAQPFKDPHVGAVAGHILVNIQDNYISKMESVRYYVSHRVNKAGEGRFGCVTCCPGAFSAYRRSAVMEVLHTWLNQRFLGVQATFGDDRSLTNYILKSYKVMYHDRARARTNVPERWMKFFKQQLRWKKSWSRETLVATRFMYQEHPIAAFQYYVGVGLSLLSPFIVTNAVILNPLMRDGTGWYFLGGLILTYLFMTCVCFYHTRTKYWAYGITFAVLYIALFAWQNYYAMLTINKTKWGTR